MKARRQVSQSASIPAPVGGWNARDSIADMPMTDAAIMNNWFPTTTDVMIRKGHTQFATGASGEIETLMVYSGGATEELFAASGGNVYDATVGGALGAAVISGMGNARYEYVNVSTAGGSFMLAVNGQDKLIGYNGTAFWQDGDGTHDITGFDTALASSVTLFKNRVWFIEENTLNLWYMGTQSIAGAAQKFTLASVARLGGNIVSIGAWTLDAGYGVDDHFVIITSKGEVIVYNGTDPASSSSWSLVGVWQIGAPIGKRCMFKYGGDMLIITQDGLVPLSASLQSSRLSPTVSLTNKIQWAVSSAVTSYGGNFGWELVYYAKQNMLIMNVPVAIGQQEQYVMNNITKNWGRFTGWDANCWALFDDEIYFGGNTFVGKAWNTLADNGTNIQAECAQAFSYFGAKGRQKRFTMIRPILQSSGTPTVLARVNTDFEYSTTYSSLSATAATYSQWGTAVWGTGVWGSTTAVTQNWSGGTSIGFTGGCELEIASNNIEVHWIATDFVFEIGGVL